MWNSVDGGCLWPIEEICRRWFAEVVAVHVESGFKFRNPFVFFSDDLSQLINFKDWISII